MWRASHAEMLSGAFAGLIPQGGPFENSMFMRLSGPLSRLEPVQPRATAQGRRTLLRALVAKQPVC